MLFLTHLVLALNGDPDPDPLHSPPTRGGKVVAETDSSLFGVTGGITATGGGDAVDRLASVSVSMRRIGYAYDQGLIVRLTNAIDLGGDARGFHGGGTTEVSGGYRFGERYGPFVRGGAEGLLAGDALVYQSLLEVPQLNLGYQYLSGHTLFEIAGRSGLSIFGRSNNALFGTGGAGGLATRSLDQVLDMGAIATAKTGPLLFTGGWSHFLARGDGSPIDWLTVSLCGKVHKFAVCVQANDVAGDVHLASGATVGSHVTQVGLTVGTGKN